MLDLQLSDNVVRIIAEKIKTNIRQLEGTVNKIKALTIIQMKARPYLWLRG